jgi:hypothetical protein
MILKLKLAAIYKIQIGEYYYIGSSCDTYSRWQAHYNLLKMNKHHSIRLQEKYNELGITRLTFSILEYISLTEYKKVSQLKGNELKKQFSRYLLSREKVCMSKYSKNFCLNKDDKHFN